MDLRQIARCLSILHELAALVLDLCAEIAWSFEEAQRGGHYKQLAQPQTL